MNRSKQWRFLFIFGVFLSMSGAVHAEAPDHGRSPASEGVLVFWNGVIESLDQLVSVLCSDNGGSLDPFGQPNSQGSPASEQPQGTGSPDSGD
ncbi:MAG TPA: hypothetical protein VKM72_16285 [Thermoanaerobaculia bacterium]|nr:hypothetical protein [Thermoanaerobaculia bacterium]